MKLTRHEGTGAVPSRTEAISRYRERTKQLIAENALKACQRREAGLPPEHDHVYHNDGDELEGKN